MWGCEGVGGSLCTPAIYEHMCKIDEYEDTLLKSIKREERERFKC